MPASENAARIAPGNSDSAFAEKIPPAFRRICTYYILLYHIISYYIGKINSLFQFCPKIDTCTYVNINPGREQPFFSRT